MAANAPETTLAERFSSPEASATEWAEGRRRVEEAELFWLSTVRPDGRPHVTPLISVWLDGAAYFCTGADERKARNLKYGSEWHFDVRDGAFHHGDGAEALVFEVSPTTAFGFGKGEYSQTRWRFD